MTVLVTREYPDLKRSIHEIVTYFDRSLDASRGFFLKPNIVFPVSPDSGQITRPVVVRAVVETLRERYGNIPIIIGEGTAAGTVPEENFRVSGYTDLARKLGVQLLNLDVAEKKKIPWEYGEIEIPSIALERVHINLPILKISSAAIFSGAIKNTKGLIPPAKKKQFHRMGLHGPLAALAKIITPDLTILDCCNFFRKRNLFLSGTDTCKIDILAAKLLNIEEPEYLTILKQRGIDSEIGPVEDEELLHFETQKRFHRKYQKFLNIRLWSHPRACSLCRQTLHRLKDFRSGHTRDSIRFYLKLAWYAFAGADFIFGSKPAFDERASRVICIGDCTKAVAQKRGCKHIPGCPPTRAHFEKYF
jgi:uncharacterized protein (DUF362 family)